MFSISTIDLKNQHKIQQIIDQKTKPLGALGKLESLAKQLALITGPEKINIRRPSLLVFAADHGIASHGVSIAPPEVTQQMVLNFLNGGAAINCFCRTNDIALKIVDAGILNPIENDNLIQQSLGRGTNDFSITDAMSVSQVQQGIKYGAELVYQLSDNGTNVFGFGEMGIGNTSSASALLSALCDLPAEITVGHGTGIDEAALAKKRSLIEKSLAIHRHKFDSVIETLAALGGFEIVQIVGAMLAAAERKRVILVDGFIASVASMAATKINPACKDYMIFCHQSEEQAHRILLTQLSVEPLLNLSLRLGEGTGAALAMPLLRAAESFYNDMASFESAGVSAV